MADSEPPLAWFIAVMVLVMTGLLLFAVFQLITHVPFVGLGVILGLGGAALLVQYAGRQYRRELEG